MLVLLPLGSRSPLFWVRTEILTDFLFGEIVFDAFVEGGWVSYFCVLDLGGNEGIMADHDFYESLEFVCLSRCVLSSFSRVSSNLS